VLHACKGLRWSGTASVEWNADVQVPDLKAVRALTCWPASACSPAVYRYRNAQTENEGFRIIPEYQTFVISLLAVVGTLFEFVEVLVYEVVRFQVPSSIASWCQF